MHRYLEATWVRTTLLMSALLAGWLATYIVPSYEQIAAAREPQKPSTHYEGSHREATGVTGIDVDQRHLIAVRSLG